MIVTLSVSEACDDSGKRIPQKSVLEEIGEKGIVILGFGHPIRTKDYLRMGPVELQEEVLIGPGPRTVYVLRGGYHVDGQHGDSFTYLDD